MRAIVKVFVVWTLGLAVLVGSSAVGLALERDATPTTKPVPGGVFVKACNGTCQCTGKDCTKRWEKANCKDKPVCTSTATLPSTVCSCVNKSPK